MTLICQEAEAGSGGKRKISGAQSCSWPMQKGHSDWLLGLGFALDLKSKGRRDLAGEKMTHRLFTASFLISGFRFCEAMVFYHRRS